MSTVYWIKNDGIDSYLNFTDDTSGGDVNIGTSSTIEVKYKYIPVNLSFTDDMDDDIANLIMWSVLEILFTGEGNKFGVILSQNNKVAQRKLVHKKTVKTSGFTRRQYDY